MTTLLNVKVDVVNHFLQKQDSVILPMPMTTDAAGTTTTLKDKVLGQGSAGTKDYNRRRVEIVETLGSGPADGEWATVTDGGFDGTDTLTFAPAMTLAPQSGTDYLLYPPDIVPGHVEHATKEVLRNTDGPHLFTPSLVADADFGANDLTNWAAVGSPDTREFVTTASRVLFGDRSLHLVTSSATVGAASNSIPATEDENLTLSVFVAVVSGSVKVQLYDVTNSAEIRSVTIAQEAWTEARFQDVVPADCKNVSIRFLSVTASSEWYVSPTVALQSQRERPYTMPSWFERETQFMESLELPIGYTSAGVQYAQVAYSEEFVEGPRPYFVRSVRNVNPFVAQLAVLANRPVSFLVKRPFAEISANTDTTACDREYLKWAVLATIARIRNLRDSRGAPTWREYSRTRDKLARVLNYGGRNVRLRENEKIMAYGGIA